MGLPDFSQKPEQIPLFPGRVIPLRVRIKAWLKGILPLIVLMGVLGIGLGQLIGRVLIIALILLSPGPRVNRLVLLQEGNEFLWFLWLVFTLVVLHLVRKKSFGANFSTRYIKIGVGVALLVYIIEVAIAVLRFKSTPSTAGIPSSLYLLGGGLIGLIVWKLPAKQLAPWRDKLEVKDYLSILNGTRTILLQIVGGGVVLGGLYYASQNMNIAQENVKFALLKEEADRLSQAITQLKDENPEVRMVAIYNLQNIATKSEKNYKLVTHVLMSYVRTRYAWKDSEEQLNPVDRESRADIESIVSFLGDLASRRMTVENDYALRGYGGSFDEFELRFRVAVLLREVNLRATDLRGLRLYNSQMEEWVLRSAHLEKTSLLGAELSHAVLDDAILYEADLTGADLSFASLKNAKFSLADLKDATLKGADIDGADLTDVINLTADMIRQTKNYDKAKLPPAILSDLQKGIP